MINQYIFDISKEHPVLARDEIISCLNAEEYQFKLVSASENAVVIQSTLSEKQINHISSRLSMTFSISKLLFKAPPNLSEIKTLAEKHPIEITGSLAVQHKNRSLKFQSKPFLHAVADVYTSSRPVDLTNPDNIIFLLITDDHVYVSKKIRGINRGVFEERKAHLRPFFSPISLHPKIARTLVNIADVKSHNLLLDPFCGTGGFLIEAGLMNITVIGSDVSKDMIQGAQKNLKYYQIKPYSMIHSDITNLPDLLSIQVDAVVTDFPYGKATSTQGERLETLYNRAMKSIQSLLRPGGKAVVGTFSNELKEFDSKQMKHLTSYPLRVHRSLTRWFHVFERRP